MVAATIALPLLTAEAIAIGIGGGYYTTTVLLGVDPAYTWEWLLKYTVPNHLYGGLTKATFFGAAIAVISCHRGFHCDAGAEGVGRAATEAASVTRITSVCSATPTSCPSPTAPGWPAGAWPGAAPGGRSRS